MTEPISCASERPAVASLAAGVSPSASRGSLAELFAAEEGPVLGFALGLVGRRPVAEELVQEAFLRLHQVWDQVENPRAWLYRSVRNLALNHLRDHARETDGDVADRPGPDAPPDVAVDRLEAVGFVRMLVAELPPEDRALLHFKYHDDLKYQDISRRTGLSVSNVGYKLHHLLKHLADALRHAGIDGPSA